MPSQKIRRIHLSLAGAAALVFAAGCQTNPTVPDRNAPPVESVTMGPIAMPTGVDYARARLIAQNRRTRIYTVLKGIGDRGNDKLLFPVEVERALGLTPAQMQRRFVDTVAQSRRFEIYDSTSTVTAEASDIVVDGQFTGTTQEIQTIEGGVRVSVTRVRLSLQMKDRYSGKLLFPAAVQVVGQTGRSTGDRYVLKPADRMSDPEVQRGLGNDYERAMQRAFDEAAARIDQVLKPMGRVLAADGNQVGLVGGSTHGLQGGDEMVVFRATTVRLGDGEVFATTLPVVVVRCDGVGTETSQCTVIRKADALAKAQAGDYAILTDRSAKGTREL